MRGAERGDHRLSERHSRGGKPSSTRLRKGAASGRSQSCGRTGHAAGGAIPRVHRSVPRECGSIRRELSGVPAGQASRINRGSRCRPVQRRRASRSSTRPPSHFSQERPTWRQSSGSTGSLVTSWVILKSPSPSSYGSSEDTDLTLRRDAKGYALHPILIETVTGLRERGEPVVPR